VDLEHGLPAGALASPGDCRIIPQRLRGAQYRMVRASVLRATPTCP
jgi:hypothetical protein